MPDEQVRLHTYGMFGAPPTTYITRKGYKQHGVTEVDFTLEPRTITLLLWRAPACNRNEYWQFRQDLHEFFRPNRTGPMTYTLIRPNGSKRQLIVRAQPGLTLPANQMDDNNWDINEELEFIAHDPVWYDPTAIVNNLTGAKDQTGLIFPITFPITFGAEGLIFSQSLPYLGTWEEKPTLRLEGPYNSAEVRNDTTGVILYLSKPLPTGAIRLVNLRQSPPNVTDAAGVSKNDELGPASNLVDWKLEPDPVAPGGVNTITAVYYGGLAGTSKFRLTYYTRYFAI